MKYKYGMNTNQTPSNKRELIIFHHQYPGPILVRCNRIGNIFLNLNIRLSGTTPAWWSAKHKKNLPRNHAPLILEKSKKYLVLECWLINITSPITKSINLTCITKIIISQADASAFFFASLLSSFFST